MVGFGMVGRGGVWFGMAGNINIPKHVPHIDCPKCVYKHFTNVAVYGKPTNPNCPWCEGEGVIREDGKPTLKTE